MTTRVRGCRFRSTALPAGTTERNRVTDDRGRGPVATGEAEAGFTLLEILIAVSILGLVLGTLTAAVMMGFRNNARAEAVTDRSNLVGFTSRLFSRDVASATGVPVADPPSSDCGGPPPAVRIPLDGESVEYAVATTVSPARSALIRRVCSGVTGVSEEIGATKWPMTASATCSDTSAGLDTVECGRVVLDVSWGPPEPFSFRLSAERRATAS